MLEYSDKAKNAYAFLYRHYNDIDVFVEDTSCIAMWENLLRVIIAERCRLHRVFQLGGKSKVLDACRKDQGESDRRRIYIIDGDFDIWRGRPKPRLKNLYRINAYCVENLLIQRDTLVEVLRDANPNDSTADVETKLKYEEFLIDCTKFLDLFASYAAIFVLGVSVPTTSYSVHKLLDRSQPLARPDERAIATRVADIYDHASKLAPKDKIRAARAIVDDNMAKKHISAILHLSRKDYLFPLLHLRCRSMVHYKEPVEVLKARLARHYSVGSDPGLRRAVERLLA